MDKAKLRLFAGIAGALLSFCGFVALAIAGTLALSETMGLIWASSLAAVTFLVVAGGCFHFFLLPTKPVEEEIEQAEEMGSSALADLPLDTLKNFVRKHPLTASTLAIVVGYSVIKDPKGATRHAQRALLGLM